MERLFESVICRRYSKALSKWHVEDVESSPKKAVCEWWVGNGGESNKRENQVEQVK